MKSGTLRMAAACGIALAALAACGGGGGSGGSGLLTVNITDAPIDSAKAVVVEFTGVAIKPADGSEIVVNFPAARQIDLLALQGGQSAPLLQGISVPAGRYEWMRLLVNAQSGTLDSYVTQADDSRRSLFIPSGSQTGLKLVSGFTVPVNAAASFTIDFDLRKSISNPQAPGSDFHLRPALRVVDNAQVGAIAGTISAGTIAACPTPLSPFVYVFEGSNVTPDDYDGAGVEPVTTASASSTAGSYAYRAAFLVPGSYTVAFTCQAAGDDPQTSETLTFLGTRTVTVTTNATTTADF